MHVLNNISRIALMALGYLNTTILSGCGGGTSTPPPVLSISFSGGNSQTIAQGQSVTITTIITNDPSAQGVTWKLTGPGALSKQTGTSVEYDAPASVARNVTAMIMATAVTDSSSHRCAFPRGMREQHHGSTITELECNVDGDFESDLAPDTILVTVQQICITQNRLVDASNSKLQRHVATVGRHGKQQEF